MRLSTSFRRRSPKEKSLQRYFVVSCVGKISILIPLIWTSLGVRVRWLPLCKIFVLSGCKCRPPLCDCVIGSAIMLLIWFKEVVASRMSSANRKFVRVLVLVWSGCKGSP